MHGKIIKGIAGFYYVHTGKSNVYACKAKGIFRKDNIKPLVGDNVVMEVTDPKDCEGNIIEILPRQSTLVRPAVANIDQALLIFAMTKPEPNFNLLDRFLIMMQKKRGFLAFYALIKQTLQTVEHRRQSRRFIVRVAVKYCLSVRSPKKG